MTITLEAPLEDDFIEVMVETLVSHHLRESTDPTLEPPPPPTEAPADPGAYPWLQHQPTEARVPREFADVSDDEEDDLDSTQDFIQMG